MPSMDALSLFTQRVSYPHVRDKDLYGDDL
jgi:hypothetical protein